ncbi:hypothetical protein FQN60_014283 [Etheostoma spectabile]|uniref:Uncharacterized protein n=1 Tax=Etheostoma spectabile TaxID=54343 RepID=A0A5J5DA25_9PERO|nr:hypothetical protein FQN60_014283 [Etheostoma spectabile]
MATGGGEALTNLASSTSSTTSPLSSLSLSSNSSWSLQGGFLQIFLGEFDDVRSLLLGGQQRGPSVQRLTIGGACQILSQMLVHGFALQEFGSDGEKPGAQTGGTHIIVAVLGLQHGVLVEHVAEALHAVLTRQARAISVLRALICWLALSWFTITLFLMLRARLAYFNVFSVSMKSRSDGLMQAIITGRQKQLTSPQLMEMPSLARSPVAPVLFSLSEPARSTKYGASLFLSGLSALLDALKEVVDSAGDDAQLLIFNVDVKARPHCVDIPMHRANFPAYIHPAIKLHHQHDSCDTEDKDSPVHMQRRFSSLTSLEEKHLTAVLPASQHCVDKGLIVPPNTGENNAVRGVQCGHCVRLCDTGSQR